MQTDIAYSSMKVYVILTRIIKLKTLDKQFLFKTEEDNEFIPLFTFNEQDMENEPPLVIEEMIPILPLRNTVLFPGVVIPITVEAPPHAVKAAIAKIANTFFIFNVLSLV